MIKFQGFDKYFPYKVRTYFVEWTNVADLNIQMTHPLLEIVSKGFETVLDDIIEESQKVIPSPYKPDQYHNDMKVLPDLINAGILPIEVIDDEKSGKMKTQDIISILNAGWIVYIAYLEEFAETKHLAEALKQNPLQVKRQLQDEISKALELQEIKTTWDELSNA